MQVVDGGRPRRGQVVEQPAPAGIGGAHPRDLGGADRVEQVRHLPGQQQVLAPMDAGDQVAALAELAEPRPFRERPGGESRAARPVRVLVARPVEARQRAIRGAGQQPALEQERLSLVKGLQRAVRREAELKRPPLAQPSQRLHTAIFPRRAPFQGIYDCALMTTSPDESFTLITCDDDGLVGTRTELWPSGVCALTRYAVGPCGSTSVTSPN